MDVDWGSVPSEDMNKVAFLFQVGGLTKDELISRFPLGLSPLKQEGGCIRADDFYGVDPNGYDLFSSDEERIQLLTKYGIA